MLISRRVVSGSGFPYVSIWLGLIPPSHPAVSPAVEALEVKYPKQWLEGASDVGQPPKREEAFLRKTGNGPQNDKGNRKVKVKYPSIWAAQEHTQNTLEDLEERVVI